MTTREPYCGTGEPGSPAAGRVTDDQRREVAERLRMCARDVNGTRDLSMYLAYWVGGMEDEIADAGNPFTVAADRRCAERTLEKLADLIDRPTCHLVEDENGYTACSECGCTALCMLDASYCPECGAVVVRDE